MHIKWILINNLNRLTSRLFFFLKLKINYSLSAENNFDINLEQLTHAYNQSLSHCIPKAILISSPNDLSGRVYSRQDIQRLVRWAHDHNLFLIVDEVNIIKKKCFFFLTCSLSIIDYLKSEIKQVCLMVNLIHLKKYRIKWAHHIPKYNLLRHLKLNPMSELFI
jgi:hypothetical protein